MTDSNAAASADRARAGAEEFTEVFTASSPRSAG